MGVVWCAAAYAVSSARVYAREADSKEGEGESKFSTFGSEAVRDRGLTAAAIAYVVNVNPLELLVRYRLDSFLPLITVLGLSPNVTLVQVRFLFYFQLFFRVCDYNGGIFRILRLIIVHV